MIRFFSILLLTVLVIIGVNFWGVHSGYWVKPSFFSETLILLAFATGLLYRYLDRASPNIFVQLYLLSIALKLLAFGAYIFAIVLMDPNGVVENIAFFMMVYFLFTALEIGFLYHKKTHS